MLDIKQFSLYLLFLVPSCVVCYESCNAPSKPPVIELQPVIVTATPAQERRS